MQPLSTAQLAKIYPRNAEEFIDIANDNTRFAVLLSCAQGDFLRNKMLQAKDAASKFMTTQSDVEKERYLQNISIWRRTFTPTVVKEEHQRTRQISTSSSIAAKEVILTVEQAAALHRELLDIRGRS